MNIFVLRIHTTLIWNQKKKQQQEKIPAEENTKCPVCNSVLGDEVVCAICTINIEKISDAEKAKYENEQKENQSKQSVKNFFTRKPKQNCWKIAEIGTVVTGRIISGKIKSGMKVRIAPNDLQGEVNELRIMNQNVIEASSGQNVSFSIKGISAKDIKGGKMIGEAQKSPPQTIKTFTAKIIIICHPGIIKTGYSPVINCHSVSFAGKFTKFISTVDRMGKVLDEKPTQLKAGQNAIIQIEPVKPVSIEKFSQFPKLGRFCIQDMKGVVLETVKSEEKIPEAQTKS